MDLKDFYRLVRRHLLMVTISILLGLAASAGITFAQTPLYQANIQLFVSTPSSAVDISALVQGSSFSQQRVKSYAQIINGPETLNPVIQQLKLRTTYTELAKKISASAPLDTVLINVSATDPSPITAAAIANAVGRQFSITVNQLELSSDTSTGGAIKVTMVKSAVPPKSPSSPKTLLNLLLGLILGFGLGVGLSIMRQIFDNSVKNEEDLNEIPLLAVIPFDEKIEKQPLITMISKWAPRTEAHRQLRTNLQFLKVDNPPRVINVTSAVPGEGKSVTSANLALSLGYAGSKVLLLEADLRRPKLMKYLGIEDGSSGLSEILSGKVILDDSYSLESITTKGTEGLVDVIPAGKTPPNPTELLASQAFEKLLEKLRGNYDYIIVDSPPSLPVADASIISAKTDGTIVIVKAGKTKKSQFVGVCESINSVGGNILGAVLNMVPENINEGDYGYKYSGGYRRRYGYGYKGYSSNDSRQPYAPQETSKKASRE